MSLRAYQYSKTLFQKVSCIWPGHVCKLASHHGKVLLSCSIENAAEYTNGVTSSLTHFKS